MAERLLNQGEVHVPGYEMGRQAVLQAVWVSLLVAGNVNLALVKQALGHRSITSTMVYVGTTDQQAAEAVRSAMMGIY